MQEHRPNHHEPRTESAERPSPESLRERLHGWRLGFSVDGESIGKAAVCALLLVFFSLLQTTLFTRFRPFGAVPDLILPLTVAVAMAFRERWGAVFGLIGAFIIESLGGSSVTILPILYMLTGYIVGLTSTYTFRDSPVVRVLYTLITSPIRMLFTLIALAAAVGEFNLITIITSILLPELCANLVFAFLPHAAAMLVFKPFIHGRD
ncbi:MAG: hypothetical protein IJC71_03650 [Clostridia bacterium]|nr:hypothetical protein [Clostridia bacterium]